MRRIWMGCPVRVGSGPSGPTASGLGTDLQRPAGSLSPPRGLTAAVVRISYYLTIKHLRPVAKDLPQTAAVMPGFCSGDAKVSCGAIVAPIRQCW